LRGDDILIIGSTGQLGSRILSRFHAAGVKPRALVRTGASATLVEQLASVYVGDLLRPETLGPAFDSAECVFVLGQPTPEMETLERNAIEAARAAGVERIVYLSNFTARIGSELRPNHIHGAHEQLVASLGVEWTVLGPTRYMTNFPFDWASVVDDGVLPETGGSGVMTCIDPEDVAEIAVKVLTEDGHDRRIYRLTSADAFTAEELASLLSSVIGRDVSVVDGPPEAGYFSLVAAGEYYNTDTAAQLLGRPPRTYREWLEANLPAVIVSGSGG
jgi:uncharacterized protein YbjT (DUF2867 family)